MNEEVRMNSNTKEKNSKVITVEGISSRVYYLRGQQVMLDYDLAEIYGYEVKRLNEQVKRNIARFPEDFMFQLTRDELISVKSQIVISREGISENCLKSQIVTLNESGNKRGLHIKKMPYAFTEQGIYMLARNTKVRKVLLVIKTGSTFLCLKSPVYRENLIKF